MRRPGGSGCDGDGDGTTGNTRSRNAGHPVHLRRRTTHRRPAASFVQVQLPVNRHPTVGTRRRLLDRVVQRRSKIRPFVELLVGIAVEPVLAGLVRTDPLMVLLARVPGRMLGGGLVAAADVTALRAPAQMEPPTAATVALPTAGPAGRNVPGRFQAHYSREHLQDVTDQTSG